VKIARARIRAPVVRAKMEELAEISEINMSALVRVSSFSFSIFHFFFFRFLAF
jgi:phosphatidylserine decarboxylase